MNFYKILTPLIFLTNIITSTVSFASDSDELSHHQNQVSQLENDLSIHKSWPERLIAEKIPVWADDSEEDLEEDISDFEENQAEEVVDDVVVDNFVLSIQETISKVENEIKQVFHQISAADSIYYQMFAPEKGDLKDLDGKRVKIFQDKQLFRLNRIIAKKIAPQLQSEEFYHSKLLDIHLESAGVITFSDNEDQYTMPIRIKLITNANVLVKEWNEKIQWKATPKTHHIRHNSHKAIIKAAENFCLNINKSIFSEQPVFAHGWDLLEYMKNYLAMISSDFSIAPLAKEKMTLPLKDITFEARVYLNTSEFFDCSLTESSSQISFTNAYHTKRNKIKIHQTKTNLEQRIALKSSIDNLLIQTNLVYDNLFAKHDKVGLIVAAADTIKYELYPHEFAKDFYITTNLNQTTQLSKIMTEDGNLNFTWIITSTRGVFTYENMQMPKIKYYDRTLDLQSANKY